MDDPAPTDADLAHDLRADLADIAKHEGMWKVSLLWADRTNYVWPEYQKWENHLPLVARAAILRAIAAEAEVERLRAETARLSKEVKRLQEDIEASDNYQRFRDSESGF